MPRLGGGIVTFIAGTGGQQKDNRQDFPHKILLPELVTHSPVSPRPQETCNCRSYTLRGARQTRVGSPRVGSGRIRSSGSIGCRSPGGSATCSIRSPRTSRTGIHRPRRSVAPVRRTGKAARCRWGGETGLRAMFVLFRRTRQKKWDSVANHRGPFALSQVRMPTWQQF
jgi:hypothetical protein